MIFLLLKIYFRAKAHLVFHLCLYDKYVLLNVLVCSIAEYFYELCCILTSLRGQVKMETTNKIFSVPCKQRSLFFAFPGADEYGKETFAVGQNWLCPAFTAVT